MEATHQDEVTPEDEAKIAEACNDFIDDYPTPDIDHPPREPKETPEQQEAFDEDEHEREVHEFVSCKTPDEFEYELTLKLKPTSGLCVAMPLPIAKGKNLASNIEGTIRRAISSEYFLQRLRATVGAPAKEYEQLTLVNPLIEEANQAQQEETFEDESQAEEVEPTYEDEDVSLADAFDAAMEGDVEGEAA